QLDGVPFAAVELHAGEPARVNVVADLGTKAILHSRPAVQIHARHSVSVVNRRKSMGNADEPDTSTRSDTTQGTLGCAGEGQHDRRGGKGTGRSGRAAGWMSQRRGGASP